MCAIEQTFAVVRALLTSDNKPSPAFVKTELERIEYAEQELAELCAENERLRAELAKRNKEVDLWRKRFFNVQGGSCT